MHIAVIGTGYVGLVTGACFTETGNHVVCMDVDENKLARLRRGELPIYEPGLEPIVESAVANGLLTFSSDMAEALAKAEYVFIAVGTPPGEDGSADLQYVLAVARSIGQHLQRYAVIIDKSTVPVGTAEKVSAAISEELAKRGVDIPFDVVSNPEFLKEGAAVEDFMRPDRVIIGTDSERAQEKMAELYAAYVRVNDRLIVMGVRDAEMTKYAANAMLATRISFMNEVASLCDRLGVDVESVRKGIGSDKRIGYAFIYPGCGYGGSCFPKDVQALIHMSRAQDFVPTVMEAVEARNEQQKLVLFDKIRGHFGGDLRGRKFGIWGLSFKPGTDDMREASSIVLIKALVEAGAIVHAYDPVALETAARELPPEWLTEGRVELLKYQYDVLKGADAMVLVTEWKRFRQPDFAAMKDLMRETVVFDGRNQYDPEGLTAQGFVYYAIGRGNQPQSL
ncbi:MAG: UDP-glucose 6-dehydrogenase [Verrucomicrobiaceae bacterium]|nr:UDP-glucose 6-dehydrogenase [Verrucomicrobiaceae bacterium]